MAKKPKGLTSDDRSIWQRVAETAVPIQHAPVSRPADKKPPKKIRAEQHPAISHFKVGARAAPLPRKHDIQKDIRQQVAEAPVNMDRKSFQNLRRGKLKPEGRIDLHGMTLAEAHPALIGFVMSSHRAGKRLVLVITGKGKHKDEGGPMPVRMGVLRHQVPEWLRMAPVASLVLQIGEAHLKHGGGGAYYVYLRRKR